jgi:FKBP-type peptidyl-prolyl cis-trans isomerase
MQQISKKAIAALLASALLAAQTLAFAPISNNLHINSITTTTTTALQSTAEPPTQIAEGLSKQIIRNGNGPPLRLGEVATVSYTCTLTDTNKIFSQSKKQKVIVGDGIMIEGWDRALATMSVGEKAIVQIDDAVKYGYGVEGVKPTVPSNARISIEFEILDAEEQKNMGVAGVVGTGAIATGLTGSGDLGALDPSKPVSSILWNRTTLKYKWMDECMDIWTTKDLPIVHYTIIHYVIPIF